MTFMLIGLAVVFLVVLRRRRKARERRDGAMVVMVDPAAGPVESGRRLPGFRGHGGSM